MTDNIVVRLRAYECAGENQHKYEARLILRRLLDEAADEIERLRTEVERLTQERDAVATRLEKALKIGAENLVRAEAAEREANELIEEMKQRRDEFALYRIAAERKVETLREALRPFALAASMIADGFPDHDIVPMRLGQCRDARAALKETTNDQD